MSSGEGTQTTIDIDPESVEAIQQTITRIPEHDAINHALGDGNTGASRALIGAAGLGAIPTGIG